MPGEPNLASEVLTTSGSWGLLGTVPEGFPQHGRFIWSECWAHDTVGKVP